MKTCLNCDFWNSEKERCDDPVDYVDEVGELACRYREGSRPRKDPYDLAFLTTIYNAGYAAGHHDTVESMFTDVHHSEVGEYHSDVVLELVTELMEDSGR